MLKITLNKEKAYRILAAFVTALLGFAIGCLFKELYDDVDNYFISLVLNKLYDNEIYCLYLHPLLCFILGNLSTLFSETDIFLLFLHSIVFAETFWLSYRLLSLSKSKFKKILSCLFPLFLIVILNLYVANYTVIAASLTFVGLLTLFTEADKKPSVLHIVIGTFFVLFGVMLRYQAALLFVPFFILKIMVLFFEHKDDLRSHVITAVKIFTPCIILCLALFVSMDLVKNSDKYSESVAYDNARRSIQDFPIEEYDTVKDKLPGISRTEYHAAAGWFLADTDVINTELFENIEDVAGKNRYDLSAEGFAGTFKEIFSFIRFNKKVILFFIISVALIVCIFLFSNSPYRKAECILALLGAFTIIFYFTFIGRAPVHIYHSILLALMFTLLTSFCTSENTLSCVVKQNTYSFLHVTVASLLFIVIALCAITGNYTKPQSVFAAKNNDNNVYDTYNQEDVYVWKDITMYFDCMDQGVLPSKEILRNNIAVGQWMYGQIYYQNMLNSIGMPNPMKSLIDDKNVYYVSYDYTFILKFLQEHYGDGCEITAYKKDEIKGIPVWGFDKTPVS